MPQTVPQLDLAAPSSLTSTRTSSSTRSRPDSTPSPFDNALRDVSKPKVSSQAKLAKTPASKPAAKQSGKTKHTSKSDPKQPVAKKQVNAHDNGQSFDQSDDSRSPAHDPSQQDASQQDSSQQRQGAPDSGHNGDASQNGNDATKPQNAKADSVSLKANDGPSNTSDAAQPAKTDKPAKRSTAQTATPDQSAAATGAATQVMQQTARPSTSKSNASSQPNYRADQQASSTQVAQVQSVAGRRADAPGASSPDETDDADAQNPPTDSSSGPGSDSDSATTASGGPAETQSADRSPPPAPKNANEVLEGLKFTAALAAQQQQAPHAAPDVQKPVAQAPTTPAAQQTAFTEANHSHIISEIQGKLLPDGGAMNLRLDPPELGTMHIRVEVKDGVVSASFSAEKDQTAKLLSHSLGELKSSLEAQGITVEKLHVTQTPKDSQSNQSQSSNNPGSSQQQQKADADKNEQQRREMLQRMWKKLMKGQDPLDLLA